jgi:hypothetical protein
MHAGQLLAIRVGTSFRGPEQAVHDYLRQSFVDTAWPSRPRWARGHE